MYSLTQKNKQSSDFDDHFWEIKVTSVVLPVYTQRKVQVGDILDELFGHSLKGAKKSKVSCFNSV